MQKQLDNRWHIGHRLLLAIVVVVSFISGSVLIGHAETAPSVEPTSSTSNAVTSSQVSQSATSAAVNGDSAAGIDTVSSTTNTVDTSESSADAAHSTTAPAADTTSTKTSTARSVATQQPKAKVTAKTATVKVIYMMDTGGVLDRDTLTGRVGQRYTATAAEFQDSRDFQLKGPKTVTGVFGKGATTIRFVYQIPRVTSRMQQGLDVITVRYADGSLKIY